jgi:hypothetical protein
MLELSRILTPVMMLLQLAAPQLAPVLGRQEQR